MREYMRRLYSAGIIHGDLSEYNVVFDEGQLVIIDVGQAVTVHHPNSRDFLERDCENVASFFPAGTRDRPRRTARVRHDAGAGSVSRLTPYQSARGSSIHTRAAEFGVVVDPERATGLANDEIDHPESDPGAVLEVGFLPACSVSIS